MIKISNLSKIYNKGSKNEFTALKGFDLQVNDGELLAIIGKSGAGKSTLLHVLACIDSYDSGEYIIDEIIIKKLSDRKLAEIRNKKIGIVMQDFALIEDYTCIENVMLPLNFARKKVSNRKEKAINALKCVDMDLMSKKKVSQLSGGQKQRVAIARAIVNNPSVILADEPTGALDSQTSSEIMKLFIDLNSRGKTIIIVTHDLEIARQCSRIIEISDGHISND